jgi:hypothetical protein
MCAPEGRALLFVSYASITTTRQEVFKRRLGQPDARTDDDVPRQPLHQSVGRGPADRQPSHDVLRREQSASHGRYPAKCQESQAERRAVLGARAAQSPVPGRSPGGIALGRCARIAAWFRRRTLGRCHESSPNPKAEWPRSCAPPPSVRRAKQPTRPSRKEPASTSRGFRSLRSPLRRQRFAEPISMRIPTDPIAHSGVTRSPVPADPIT